MSLIRGSLPELVARLEALDAQREALRAVIAQRLNLGPAASGAQARAPQRAPRPPARPAPEVKRPPQPASANFLRRDEILKMAKTHGVLRSEHLAMVSGLHAKAAASRLSKMAQRGELIRVGIGRYSLPRAGKSVAGRGERRAQVTALGVELATKGESLTPERVAEALGVTANNAQVVMANMVSTGSLLRISKGIYALPPGGPDTDEGEDDASGKDTDRAVALAMQNDGVVDADAIVAAGIKRKRPLALAMLRKLHARGRLERVAPETYATPDKAASMRALKKMERAAEKNAERAP